MQIFSQDFLTYSEEDILKELKTNGYFCFERALTQEFIDEITKTVEENRFGINTNWINGVYVGTQYYLTHMLAVSKEFYSYVTHEKVMKISNMFLGEKIRLKAMRYYETMGGHRMQWHTDNKTDKEFAHIPGMIFICYLMDVNDGEFQYVAGSHEWSGTRAYSDYSEEEIEMKYKDQIVSFKKPSGSIVIYNTYGIHRAKPVQNKSYIRKSLFFQVDSDVASAEPIILNPSFCEHLTNSQKDYLGFGMSSDFEVFPNSKFKDHPITSSIFGEVSSWLSYRITRRLSNSVRGFKSKIKKLL